MADVILAVTCPIILAYLALIGKKGNLHKLHGWGYILSGFAFIVCGVLISIADSFLGLENSLIIGSTSIENFLAAVVGYLPGFTFLAVGFRKWIPAISSLDEARNSLQQSQRALDSQICEHEEKLKSLESRLSEEIDQHRHAEEALHKSEARYQQLLDRAATGICLVRDEIIQYANLSLLALVGCSTDELLGARMSRFFHEDQLERLAGYVDECLSDQNASRSTDAAWIRPDGTIAQVKIALRAMPVEDHTTILIEVYDNSSQAESREKIRSQTQEIQAYSRELEDAAAELRRTRDQLVETNERLRETEKQLQDLLDNVDDGILRLNLHGRILEINAKAEEILGRPRNEAIHKNLEELSFLEHEDTAAISRGIERAVEGEIVPVRECRVRPTADSVLYMEIRPILLSQGGEPRSIIILMRDITQRRITEEALERERNELNKRVQERTNALAMASQELQVETAARKEAEDLLSQTTSRWNSVMSISPDILMVVDGGGRILSINRTMTGDPAQRAIGKNIYDFTHPEDRRTVQEEIESVFLTGLPSTFEIVGRGPNHSTAWYEIQMGPVNSGCEVIAVTLIVRDITEKKFAEETLRESQERFRELADFMPQTLFEIDVDGNFTFANNAGLQTTGYVQEDIDRGLNALQLFVPEDQKRVLDHIERTLKGEHCAGAEFTAVKKDGAKFRVAVYSTPIIRHEKVIGMRGIILDITERKNAEEQVIQRNRELAALNAIAQTVTQSVHLDDILNRAVDKILEILNIAQGGIYLLDPTSETLWLRIHRGIAEDLREAVSPLRIGQGLPGVVARSGEPAFIESLPDSVEWIGKRLRDTVITERLRSVMCLPLKARGTVLGVMFAMTQGDRSLDSQDRQMLITMSHAISTAVDNAQLIEAASKARAAQEAEELRAAFLASISHEIRTPLTEIKGFATTLVQPDIEWDPDTQKDFLLGINKASDRLLQIVIDVLDMTKIQAGVLELERRPLKLAKLVSQLQSKYNTPAWHSIEAHVPDDLPPVSADDQRIAQAMTKLVENAALETGPIRVEASVAGDHLVVSVSDSGQGIPPDEIDKVFDPFYRIEENTQRRTSGSGLGLAICKGIIEAHGGSIWVESQHGRGSKFSFTLPLEDSARTEPERTEVLV